jgi:hypothetical protein
MTVDLHLFRQQSASASFDGKADQILEPGDFPLSALNPVQRAIVEQTAETYQIDPALPAMTGISVLSGATGKTIIVTGAVSGRRTHLNLYCIAGAPKSYGKNAAATLVRPLSEASDEKTNQFNHSEKPNLLAEQKIKEHEAKEFIKNGDLDGLAKNQARLLEIGRLLARAPTLIAPGNSTTAALTEILKRNEEMIFSYATESGEPIRIVLGKYNKDQAADFDLYLNGYTVESARESRISRGDSGQFVPCISLLWFCQPMLLRELFTNEEALERGLTARVLPFIVEHDNIPEDDGILRNVSAKAEENWDLLVRRALDLRNSSYEIHCSKEAREVFRAFHNEAVQLRNGKYREIEGELGRWRENAIKTAGGQCVADAIVEGRNPNELVLVSEQAERGVKIARWSHLHSIAMLHKGMSERHWNRIKTLCDLLATRYNGSATLRDLSLRHGFVPLEVKSLVLEYPETLMVEMVQHGAGTLGGRPSETLRFTKREQPGKA